MHAIRVGRNSSSGGTFPSSWTTGQSHETLHLVRFGCLIAQDWTLRHGRSSRSSNYELGGVGGCAGGLVLEPIEGRGAWKERSTLG